MQTVSMRPPRRTMGCLSPGPRCGVRPCSIANSVAPARVRDAGLGVDVFDVTADGLRGDAECVRHLLVGVAACDQTEHLDLPIGQAGGIGTSDGPRWSRRPLPTLHQPQPAQSGRGQHRRSSCAAAAAGGRVTAGAGGPRSSRGRRQQRRADLRRDPAQRCRGDSPSRPPRSWWPAARSASGTSSLHRRSTRSLRYGWSRAASSHCSALGGRGGPGCQRRCRPGRRRRRWARPKRVVSSGDMPAAVPAATASSATAGE